MHETIKVYGHEEYCADLLNKYHKYLWYFTHKFTRHTLIHFHFSSVQISSLFPITLNTFLHDENIPPVFSHDQDLVKAFAYFCDASCATPTRSAGFSTINIPHSVFEVDNHSLKLTYYITAMTKKRSGQISR